MNNRSLSPSQKPLFPILHLWIVYLSHCPYSLSFFPHISTIVFFWTFPFFHLPICFLLRVSCHSYHRVMCWVTHLASPGREVPCPASTTIPNIFFLMGLTGSRSFVGLRLCLLKKQNWCRTKTMRGGLSFISGPSGGSTWSCSRPLSALNCTTAFINYQLISSKYDYLCSHTDDWWDFQRNT